MRTAVWNVGGILVPLSVAGTRRNAERGSRTMLLPADGLKPKHSQNRKIRTRNTKGYRMSLTKKCDTCHWYDKTEDAPCAEQKCMINRKHPFWEPMQNGDMVRRMSNEQIADHFSDLMISKGDLLDWLDSEVEDNEH